MTSLKSVEMTSVSIFRGPRHPRRYADSGAHHGHGLVVHGVGQAHAGSHAVHGGPAMSSTDVHGTATKGHGVSP